MTRKRALPSTGSILSSASTESTGSTDNSALEAFAGAVEGWMYWKRDPQCWTKVYVVLRKHFLWLLRSPSSASLASPLIHMAVVGVERTTLRSFLVTGPSNETMELHLYDEDEVWTWFDALVEAADWTRLSIEERERLDQEARSRRSSIMSSVRPSLASSSGGGGPGSGRGVGSARRASVDRAYRGTLVVYNEERKGSRWRQFWRSLHLKESFRKKVENVVDRFETAQARATLY